MLHCSFSRHSKHPLAGPDTKGARQEDSRRTQQQGEQGSPPSPRFSRRSKHPLGGPDTKGANGLQTKRANKARPRCHASAGAASTHWQDQAPKVLGKRTPDGPKKRASKVRPLHHASAGATSTHWQDQTPKVIGKRTPDEKGEQGSPPLPRCSRRSKHTLAGPDTKGTRQEARPRVTLQQAQEAPTVRTRKKRCSASGIQTEPRKGRTRLAPVVTLQQAQQAPTGRTRYQRYSANGSPPCHASAFSRRRQHPLAGPGTKGARQVGSRPTC
jgi:hypothetical protein